MATRRLPLATRSDKQEAVPASINLAAMKVESVWGGGRGELFS